MRLIGWLRVLGSAVSVGLGILIARENRRAQARENSDAQGVVYWRQSLTVTAASLRARDGDRVAEKRLAWRKTVVERQQYAERLESNVKAIDREVARML